MKSIEKLASCVAAAAVAITMASSAMADVNVAFFLEWATPNQEDKVKKVYDDALGTKVNWTNFDAGTAMTEAMLAGDIDISYSQGLAPFVNGVNASAPIKMVALAVAYPANDCFVRNDAGIDASNANELEGQSVAVPLNTMADYSFRVMMKTLGVDVSKIKVIDQAPEDGAVSLTDGNVVMACIFGGNSAAKAREVGTPIMSEKSKQAAGIVSFDVVSVTEKFAQENPEQLRTFLQVTDEANTRYNAGKSDMEIIAKDAGMKLPLARDLISTFVFPSNKEQLSNYFSKGGPVEAAINFVGQTFATAEAPALADYSAVIDTSFLK